MKNEILNKFFDNSVKILATAIIILGLCYILIWAYILIPSIIHI